MPRHTATIRAPGLTKDGTVEISEVTGQPVWLEVDGKRVRFLLQDGPQIKLTHYATGRVVGNLSARRLTIMASVGPQNTPPDRRIAQRMIDDVIAQNGIEKVLAEFGKHEILNP
jgi:hypothetical protein